MPSVLDKYARAMNLRCAARWAHIRRMIGIAPERYARPRLPAAQIHPSLQYTRLGAKLREAATGDDDIAGLARAAIDQPHDKPLDVLPLHVLRDAVQEHPDHPLAKDFNWERLPERVELDEALRGHLRDLNRSDVTPFDVIHEGRWRIPFRLRKKFPWANGRELEDSARRLTQQTADQMDTDTSRLILGEQQHPDEEVERQHSDLARDMYGPQSRWMPDDAPERYDRDDEYPSPTLGGTLSPRPPVRVPRRPSDPASTIPGGGARASTPPPYEVVPTPRPASEPLSFPSAFADRAARHAANEKAGNRRYAISDALRARMEANKPRGGAYSVTLARHKSGRQYVVVGQHDQNGNLVRHAVFGWNEIAPHATEDNLWLRKALQRIRPQITRANPVVATARYRRRRKYVRIQYPGWHEVWKQPGLRFPASLLWRIAGEEDKYPESGERAAVALGGGQTNVLSELNDALQREGHPLAGVIDWGNVPRAVELNDHVIQFLRSNNRLESRRGPSHSIMDRARIVFRPNRGLNPFVSKMGNIGYRPEEVFDSLRRIGAHDSLYGRGGPEWDRYHESDFGEMAPPDHPPSEEFRFGAKPVKMSRRRYAAVGAGPHAGWITPAGEHHPLAGSGALMHADWARIRGPAEVRDHPDPVGALLDAGWSRIAARGDVQVKTLAHPRVRRNLASYFASLQPHEPINLQVDENPRFNPGTAGEAVHRLGGVRHLQRYARKGVPFGSINYGMFGSHKHKSGINQVGRILNKLVSTHRDETVRSTAESALKGDRNALLVLQDRLQDIGDPYAFMNLQGLADAHADARSRGQFLSGRDADRIALTPRKLSRRQYARARLVAHPLVEGFPIETALRKLANARGATRDVRALAKRVLVHGDTEALWGLNDALHESGHPMAGYYNWLAAADKLHLDRHVYEALKDEAERKRRHLGNQAHLYSWAVTPESRAAIARDAANGLRHFDNRDVTDSFYGGILDRVRAGALQRAPQATPEQIDESIRRHGVRSDRAHRRFFHIDPPPRDQVHQGESGDVKPLPKEFRSTEHKASMLATRYARRRYASLPSSGGFLDALRRVRSTQQRGLTQAVRSVVRKLGLTPAQVHDVVHDAPGRAAPGAAVSVYGGWGAPDRVRAAASWLGLYSRSPGMGVFHVRPSGPDGLYRMRLAGAGADLRARLDRAGISQRVLIPHRQGFDVLVPDRGRQQYRAVRAFADQQGVPLEASAGHFQTIGAADPAGGRAAFRGTIRQQEQMSRRGRVRRYARETLNHLISAAERGYEVPEHAFEDAAQDAGLAPGLGAVLRTAHERGIDLRSVVSSHEAHPGLVAAMLKKGLTSPHEPGHEFQWGTTLPSGRHIRWWSAYEEVPGIDRVTGLTVHPHRYHPLSALHVRYDPPEGPPIHSVMTPAEVYGLAAHAPEGIESQMIRHLNAQIPEAARSWSRMRRRPF